MRAEILNSVFKLRLTEPKQNGGAQDDSIPAKHFEGMGLNKAQEPFHHHKGNHGGDQRADKERGPIFRWGAWRGMMQGFEHFEAAGRQHGWNAHEERKLRRLRAG